MSIKRIGSIKDYTPNFKIIIPRFDLATWHDYIEENFRNIDALFFNLFGINNYSGSWKQITTYTEGQVLFIPDDRDINGEETIYSGRLVKVLVDHVTDNSDYFNVFYNSHPEYYELFTDASSAQIFAQQAQDASKEAKNSENVIIQKQTEINDTISEFNANVVTKTEELSQQIAEGIEIVEQNTQIAVNNAEKSRIWAEGEQAEVQNLGGELSSMGAADLAYALSNAPEDQPIDASPMFALKIFKGEKGDKGDRGDNGKDGTDGKDGAEGKSFTDGYVTNCITEIPQDIKLELNDGTLTLKAGSKVYVPNGFEADGVTPKFDVVVIESDLYLKQQYDDNDMFMIVYTNPNGIRNLGSVFKGSNYETRPTAVGDYKLHYITSENKIFWDAPNYVTTENSFPIAIVDRSADVGFTSIDQVFNGFGYIGSTIFALPGVKGLIPNGRNADGSLKNIEYTTQSVLLYTFSQDWSGKSVVFSISKEENEVRIRPSYYFFEQGTIPSTITSSQWLNTESNLLYQTYTTATSWSDAFLRQAFICGCLFVSNETKVSNFNHKTAFRAVDYNDKATVVGWIIPDYTAGIDWSTAGTYTAPSSGWITGFIRKSGSPANASLYINDVLVARAGNDTAANTYWYPINIFIEKGQIYKAEYSATSIANSIIKFFPCKGVN